MQHTIYNTALELYNKMDHHLYKHFGNTDYMLDSSLQSFARRASSRFI
jgi:hypothetical protein